MFLLLLTQNAVAQRPKIYKVCGEVGLPYIGFTYEAGERQLLFGVEIHTPDLNAPVIAVSPDPGLQQRLRSLEVKSVTCVTGTLSKDANENLLLTVFSFE